MIQSESGAYEQQQMKQTEVRDIDPRDETSYVYYILAELFEEFLGGSPIYYPGTRVFSPRSTGEPAYQACLQVWNKFIVPETVEGKHGRCLFRYQIYCDWLMGGGEWSEFRYSDKLILFDLRSKMPTKPKKSPANPASFVLRKFYRPSRSANAR